MKRTNIYLDEMQAATLDNLAHSRGISRAALIRCMLDEVISGTQTNRLSDDLAAIDASFRVLREGEDFVARGPDERSRHLERISGR
jgi:hypothetical protein